MLISARMALYSCPECNHEYSSKALMCPGCGRMFRGRMWWATTIGWGVIFSAVISFFLMLLFYAILIAVLGPLFWMHR